MQKIPAPPKKPLNQCNNGCLYKHIVFLLKSRLEYQEATEQEIMLDSDLAERYGVKTKQLKKQVRLVENPPLPERSKIG